MDDNADLHSSSKKFRLLGKGNHRTDRSKDTLFVQTFGIDINNNTYYSVNGDSIVSSGNINNTFSWSLEIPNKNVQ